MTEAHRRIDEGVQRGPRKKPGPPKGSPRRGGTGNAIIPRKGIEGDQAIYSALIAYSQGYTLTEIAEQYKVTERAIRAWLLNEVPDQYRNAQTLGLLQHIADADAGIAEAKELRDVVLLACAREQARFARMDLERRRPHLYGPKQEITHNVQPVFVINAALPQDLQVIDLPSDAVQQLDKPNP